MKLIPVACAEDSITFLYHMLMQRTQMQSISHKELPSFEDHAAFVQSEPYEAWYIIVDTGVDDCYVGSVYLTKNREVGLFIDQTCTGEGLGPKALDLLHKKHPGPLLANVAIKNVPSLAFFIKQGFEILSLTLRRE